MKASEAERKEQKDTNKFTISGGYDERVTPVPIPNTEVKPLSAERTWLETARELRSPPESIWKISLQRGDLLFYAILKMTKLHSLCIRFTT